MKIILDGIVESISSRADGSLKIVFGTQEIESKQAGELFELRGKYAKALLTDANITQDEEAAVEDTFIQGGKKKTKSGRLRAILFVVWKNSNLKNTIKFEDFYSTEMEMLIDKYKEKLEPADDDSN